MRFLESRAPDVPIVSRRSLGIPHYARARNAAIEYTKYQHVYAKE